MDTITITITITHVSQCTHPQNYVLLRIFIQIVANFILSVEGFGELQPFLNADVASAQVGLRFWGRVVKMRWNRLTHSIPWVVKSYSVCQMDLASYNLSRLSQLYTEYRHWRCNQPSLWFLFLETGFKGAGGESFPSSISYFYELYLGPVSRWTGSLQLKWTIPSWVLFHYLSDWFLRY